MVELKPTHKVPTARYVRALKRKLPREIPELRTFFSSGSIIDSVLNFGLPAPIDIQLSGPHYADLFEAARRVQARIRALPQVAQHVHSRGVRLSDAAHQRGPRKSRAPRPEPA